MDLLPRSHTEFVSEDYWDKFYKKRGAKAFEWYGEYPELCGVLSKYVKTKEKILMVGCGNSKLSEDMYDVGYHGIVNIDISDVVIRQMIEKNAQQRPLMSFLRMDVTQTSFEEGEFSVVIDKGTLDALMVDSNAETVSTVDKMFSELARVLRLGGRYICVTLLQEHIAAKLFSHFVELGWPIRVHRVEKETYETEQEFSLPAFVIVLTKFKKMENMKPIIEFSSSLEKADRLEDVEKLKTVVKEIQYYSMVKQQIARKLGGEQASLCLYTSTSEEPRYTLHVVDRLQKTSQKFAVFIVPQGRETDWMFSQDAGRKQLADSAGYERLVVVTLHRTHTYTDLETVKSELSDKVMELSPPNFRKGVQVPFLSLGDDLGQRHILVEGESEISGKYVVEDVETDDGKFFRRLIFLNAPNIIQSETRLVLKAKKKGKIRQYNPSKLAPDQTFLACQHHLPMIGGLAFLPEPTKCDVSVLLIGLGGGGLSSFIHHHFNKVKLEVVDLDPKVVEIAEKYFFVHQDDRLKVHVADGLQFIQQAAKEGKQYDIVMFDADSKDRSVGISCPPMSFLEEWFLKETSTITKETGVFVINLVARDEMLKKTVMERLQSIFHKVMFVHIEDEVNDIVFCLRNLKTEHSEDSASANFVSEVKARAAILNDAIQVTSSRTEVDFSDAMKKLSIADNS